MIALVMRHCPQKRTVSHWITSALHSESVRTWCKILTRLAICTEKSVRHNLQAVLFIGAQRMTTGVGHECAGTSQCIRNCRCSRRASALYCLTVAYSRLQSAGDHGDPTLDFLRGHLAMLFGLLMQENVANQMVLLKTLPGSSDSVKLHTLLCQAQEFLAVYAAFRSRLFATSTMRVDQNDMMPSITEDRKAESVARDVIVLLQTLCDRVRDH